MTEFMQDVTDVQITVPVIGPVAFDTLAAAMEIPDRVRVTHTILVAGQLVAGVWVVVAARKDYDSRGERQYWITLARLRED